jgi:hypothetical protein
MQINDVFAGFGPGLTLPNFRDSDVPAKASLEIAQADQTDIKMRRYMEKLTPTQVFSFSSIQPVLDRSIGLGVGKPRQSSIPAITSLENAIAQLGTEKAGKLVAANKALYKGNFDAVEYYLGVPLTSEKTSDMEKGIIREHEIAKIREETRKAINAAKIPYIYTYVPKAHPVGPQAPPAARPAAPRPSAVMRPPPLIMPAPKSPGSPHLPSGFGPIHPLLGPSKSSPPPSPSSLPSNVSSGRSGPRGAAAAAAATPNDATGNVDYTKTQLPFTYTDLSVINNLYGESRPFATRVKNINTYLESIGRKKMPANPTRDMMEARLNVWSIKATSSGAAAAAAAAPASSSSSSSAAAAGQSGNGISARKRDNVAFGKYIIDKKKLSSNILSFAHKSGPGTGSSARRNHTVTGLPAIRISAPLKGVVMEILNGMPVNLDALDSGDMTLFNRIIKVSKKTFDSKISNNNNELMSRLSILIGEIAAGNNSKALKTELSQTLNSLNKAGLVTNKQVIEATRRYI